MEKEEQWEKILEEDVNYCGICTRRLDIKIKVYRDNEGELHARAVCREHPYSTSHK